MEKNYIKLETQDEGESCRECGRVWEDYNSKVLQGNILAMTSTPCVTVILYSHV